jgi:hypothetical protein
MLMPVCRRLGPCVVPVLARSVPEVARTQLSVLVGVVVVVHARFGAVVSFTSVTHVMIPVHFPTP